MKDIKFIQPVSMVVTKEQFERDLKSILEVLGYRVSYDDCSNPAVLVTDFTETPNLCTNLLMESITSIDDRYFIDSYNPELFLALAAMTEGDIPIVGECMISLKEFCEDNIIYKKNELIKVTYIDNLYKNGFEKGDFGENYERDYFRKATKEEIINWFTIKKEMETKEIKIEIPEGYEIDENKSTFTNIVFKPIKKYPTSIDEVKGRNVNFSIDGFITNPPFEYNTNLSTIERVKAIVALIQLVELRDAWNKIDSFEVNWKNERQVKYALVMEGNVIFFKNVIKHKKVLYFGSTQTRELFFKTFGDLIITAKEFI